MDELTDQSLKFIGRLRGNSRLDALAAPHVTRPPGRPPREGYEYIAELGNYQADSWRHAQRVILVVVDRPDPVTGQLNLLPDYFFLVTNWSERERSAEALLTHYRGRGTFEDRLGEFNEAVKRAAYEYATHSAGGATVHPAAKETVFRNEDGTGTSDTEYQHLIL